MSPVTVPQITNSISPGSASAIAIAFFAARMESTDVVSSGLEIRRSRMPVR